MVIHAVPSLAERSTEDEVIEAKRAAKRAYHARYNREHYAEHKARYQARNVAYYLAHKDEFKGWTAANYAENKARYKTLRAAYYLEHKDEYKKRKTALKTANPQYDRIQHLSQYGLTLEAFDALLQVQNGRCAICRVAFADVSRGAHVDHDHSSGRVRGLLCTHCNRGLGGFRDSPASLAAAISYLGRD